MDAQRKVIHQIKIKERANRCRNDLRSLIRLHGDRMLKKTHPMADDRNLFDYAMHCVENSANSQIGFALERIRRELKG